MCKIRCACQLVGLSHHIPGHYSYKTALRGDSVEFYFSGKEAYTTETCLNKTLDIIGKTRNNFHALNLHTHSTTQYENRQNIEWNYNIDSFSVCLLIKLVLY